MFESRTRRLYLNYGLEIESNLLTIYLLSSLGSLFVTGADRIVLWVTLAYAREYMNQHNAYAPVTKRDPRELSRYKTECISRTKKGCNFA